MAEKKLKCAGCGSMVDATTMSKISGQNYCPHCAPARKKEALAHSKLNRLLYQLCDNNGDYLPRFNREIDTLIAKYNWKLTGILSTFNYVFTLPNPPNFNPETGVTWILERYYPEAKKYYTNLYDLQHRFTEELIEEHLNKPVQEIEVKRSDIIKKDLSFAEYQRTITYGPPIDLNDIEIEEDEE